MCTLTNGRAALQPSSSTTRRQPVRLPPGQQLHALLIHTRLPHALLTSSRCRDRIL